MSYYVDLGVVTDEKGINTILASDAGKQLQDNYGITIYQSSSDNVYHFLLEDVKYGWLEHIGLFETLKQLEYCETLLVGEDINDIEHTCVWPESMNDDPPLNYLSLKRKIVADDDLCNRWLPHQDDEEHIKKTLDL